MSVVAFVLWMRAYRSAERELNARRFETSEAWQADMWLYAPLIALGGQVDAAAMYGLCVLAGW